MLVSVIGRLYYAYCTFPKPILSIIVKLHFPETYLVHYCEVGKFPPSVSFSFVRFKVTFLTAGEALNVYFTFNFWMLHI
jgi:hypothetical protein